MYPYLFGIKFINMYGFCIGVGVIACLMFLRFACKRLNIPSKFEDFVEYNAIISIVIGILSGMLFQSFYNWIDDLKTNPDAVFRFSTDNITFLGGLIGGVITFLLIYFLFGRKRYGAYLMRLLPIAACCILVAHAFGRLGCLCSGCCHGTVFEEQQPWTIYFPKVCIYTPDGEMWRTPGWKYPTQLFESLFLFATFGVCAFLTVKKRYKFTMNIYLIAYGVFRFFIEFIRGDERGEIIPGLPLSPSQFWAIIMIIMGFAFYFIMPIVIKKLGVDYDAPLPTEEKLDEVTEN